MKEYILGIDPSNKASAFCLVELPTLKPIDFGFLKEDDMLDYVENCPCDDDKVVYLAIEGMQNLGQVIGKDVFNTAYLVGRLYERASLVPILDGYWTDTKLSDTFICGHSYKDIKLIFRNQEKKVICGKASRVKDKDIRQALINRFAKFDHKNGKGSKQNQDWFYGFSKDVWQAYGICLTAYELYWKS